MFYTLQRTRPFYEELDFRNPHVEEYLRGALTHRQMVGEGGGGGDGDGEESGDEGESGGAGVDVGSIQHLSHLYITGPKGCGKTTQIYALMASVVNNRNVYSLKNRTFQRTFHYKCSQFHVEFSAKSFKNMSDITTSHQFVISISSSRNIAYGIPRFIYIRDFHLCNEINQKFFLRIVEKNSSNVRFLLEGDSSFRPIEPISSRFYTLYIPMVPLARIREVVQQGTSCRWRAGAGAGAEAESPIRDEIWQEIVRNSSVQNWIHDEAPTYHHYNMKNIFGILAVYKSDMSKRIYKPVLITKCVALQRLILGTTEKNFFENMNTIREILLELFVNNVSSTFVLEHFLRFACAHAPNDEKREIVVRECSEIGHQMNMSNKDIFFLELFLFLIIKHLNLLGTFGAEGCSAPWQRGVVRL